MKCEQFRQALYEGRSLPEGESHADSCPECAALAGRLSELDALLRFEIVPDPKYVDFRKRLLLQKIAASEPAPAHAYSFRVVRFALVVAVLMFVFLLPQSTEVPSQKPQQPVASARQKDVPFELQKIDDLVKLTWKGPAGQYRILKGPTPASLKPIESVHGLTWIDRSADSSPIIFYKVEAL